MKTAGLEDQIVQHAFFSDMQREYVELLAGCSRHTVLHAGDYIHREGDEASSFFAIRQGRVAIEVDVPGRGPLVIETLEQGDLLGWSWLFPPYSWRFDARVVELTRAFEFDATCLRGKLDADPVMGYDFMRRFATVFVRRFEAARMQLVDLYGNP